MLTWLRACRVHQWLKNLLVFFPLFASHSSDPAQWRLAVMAFVGFGLCASSVYLVNDILDIEHDRLHPRKRLRPFAAGLLPPRAGLLVAICLLAAALVMALALPMLYGCTLALYLAMTLAYSLLLKRVAILDVLVLAGLYTIRLIAGASAVSIVPSVWLLCFSLFAFLSLACLKRYTELIDLKSRELHKANGRGYDTEDLLLIAVQGNAAGYLAVLVLVLYINSKEVTLLYPAPQWLWGISVILLYWFNRSWWLAHRRRLHDDPIVYAVTDPTSLSAGFACAVCIAMAHWAG